MVNASRQDVVLRLVRLQQTDETSGCHQHLKHLVVAIVRRLGQWQPSSLAYLCKVSSPPIHFHRVRHPLPHRQVHTLCCLHSIRKCHREPRVTSSSSCVNLGIALTPMWCFQRCLQSLTPVEAIKRLERNGIGGLIRVTHATMDVLSTQ